MLYIKFYMEINYFQIEKEFSLKREYEVIQSQVSKVISFKLQKKGKLVDECAYMHIYIYIYSHSSIRMILEWIGRYAQVR